MEIGLRHPLFYLLCGCGTNSPNIFMVTWISPIILCKGFSRAHCMISSDYYWFRAWKIKILVQQSFSNRPLIQLRTIAKVWFWFLLLFRTYSNLYNKVIVLPVVPMSLYHFNSANSLWIWLPPVDSWVKGYLKFLLLT